MTIKLPEPVGATYTIAGVQHCTLTQEGPDTDLYTADQLKQAVRDALEQAALFCAKNQVWVGGGKRGLSEFDASTDWAGGIHQGMDYAAAIRAMIKEIK